MDYYGLFIVRILLLGPSNDRLRDFIAAYGDEVVDLMGLQYTEWIVSYRYREMVSPNLLAQVNHQAINLHTGALPWNAGSDPNLHAWKDHTPHGVTLHWMTQELDKGPMIAQRRLLFSPGETLRTSYLRLDAEAIALFMEYWPELRRVSRGSSHRTSDRPALPYGWDTPVETL
jgi:methionyl-tRNA formyltransferase